MATHSSILAWRIPWMEEPGRLQSTGSQRVGHDWATSPSPSLEKTWMVQKERINTGIDISSYSITQRGWLLTFGFISFWSFGHIIKSGLRENMPFCVPINFNPAEGRGRFEKMGIIEGVKKWKCTAICYSAQAPWDRKQHRSGGHFYSLCSNLLSSRKSVMKF